MYSFAVYALCVVLQNMLKIVISKRFVKDDAELLLH